MYQSLAAKSIINDGNPWPSSRGRWDLKTSPWSKNEISRRRWCKSTLKMPSKLRVVEFRWICGDRKDGGGEIVVVGKFVWEIGDYEGERSRWDRKRVVRWRLKESL